MASSRYPRLLISENSIPVLPSLAVRIGLDEAIVLQQIHFWLITYEQAKDERHFKKGRYWVYNTIESWQANQFPWWSVPTVKRIFTSLEQLQVVISERFDAKNHNQTKWYTLDYNVLHIIADIPDHLWKHKREERIKLIQSAIQRADPVDQINLIQSEQINLIQSEQIILTRSAGSDCANVPCTERSSKRSHINGGTPNRVPPNPLPTQSACVQVEELSEHQEEETALSHNLTPSHDDAPSTSPEHKTTSLLANQPSKEDQNFRADCKDLQQGDCQNKQDVGAKRFVDSYTGKQSSCASDPWMENHNPVPAFKEWLWKKQKANGWKNASPANAASEIRKDYVRASEHWQEFLADNVKQFQGYLARLQSGLALTTSDWEWLKALAPHTPDKTLVEAVMAICGREQQKEGESLCTVRETQREATRPEIAWEMGTDPIAEIMKRKKPIRIGTGKQNDGLYTKFPGRDDAALLRGCRRGDNRGDIVRPERDRQGDR